MPLVVELIHRLLHGKRQWYTSKPHEVHTTHPNGDVTVTHVSHGPIPHWPLTTDQMVTDSTGTRSARVEVNGKDQ